MALNYRSALVPSQYSRAGVYPQALNGTPPSKECTIEDAGELDKFEPYPVDL